MTGFVKAMRTEESTFLDMHPNANHMLNVIARRARRTPCHLNKLEIGECFIGHKGLGLTERQYRTAKKQLEEWRMVEFKKGRKATDKGTVAKLLNTKVYDINEELGDGRKTDERRKGDGKATTNKECKNEKNEDNINIFNFEDIKASWNELSVESDCVSKKTIVFPEKAKKDLPKIYKKYEAIKKSLGKEPESKNNFCKSYFKAVLDWAEPWAGKGNMENFKVSLEYSVRIDTFDKVMNWVAGE